jgi:hypothetical protein
MRPADDIKRLIDTVQVTSSSQVDRRILGDALEDLEKRRADRLTRRPGVWRVVMRTRIGKLTVAAAAILVLVIVVQQFGGPAAGTGVAWGDVRDAFLQQHWVHVKYDNGEERWSNLQTGDSYFKNWDGRCVAVDYARNLRQAYYAPWGRHIDEDRPVRYQDGVIPPWKPETAWDSALGHWEQMAERGKTGDWEVERHSDQTGGVSLIRFDCYFHDAAGWRLLIERIWADPKTRLPLTVWERLSLADRRKQERESITGTFDFPETGPASIYDLGVARDLPVSKSYDKVPALAVQEIMAGAKAALARFPVRYRAVVWDNTKETEIDVIWRDGTRLRMDHYFNLPFDMHPQHHLALPAQVQDVLRWTQTQTPISTYMTDGAKEYTRHYVHPVYPDSQNEARVLRVQGRDGLPLSCRPIEEQWFYAELNPAGLGQIADAPEELRKYLGLRTNAGDIRREYYVDPEHDYICVRNIWWKQRSGQWEKEREEECSGLTSLPQGQWYATKRSVVNYPNPERGTVKNGANWTIDVQLLPEADFPPGTFNGDKLLEGAKVETY